ncbi:MAG: shikimate kinase [Ignavibacteria bacterium]|nr:MAG: shikimate kinase [Ignavibacteria bacterium]
MGSRRKNLIYLTGFMGSGKSTIAPILANTLGYSYRDIDSEIELATGKRVSELFTDHGEKYFRDVERRLLQEASRLQGCIISLGGGTIANEINLQIVKSSGVLIYLAATVDQIMRRVRNKSNRPLLLTPDGERLSEDALQRRIAILLRERIPYYEQADVTVVTGDQPVGLTIDKIVRSINGLVE